MLKLDKATMFELQQHTQSSQVVPDYAELLGFLEFHARASENTVQKGEWKCQVPTPEKWFKALIHN